MKTIKIFFTSTYLPTLHAKHLHASYEVDALHFRAKQKSLLFPCEALSSYLRKEVREVPTSMQSKKETLLSASRRRRCKGGSPSCFAWK